MPEKTPTVAERIKAIHGDIDLKDVVSVEYSWYDPDNTGAGYEKLVIKNAGRGGYSYTGVYHPDVHCEGDGVCKHCGKTL